MWQLYDKALEALPCFPHLPGLAPIPPGARQHGEAHVRGLPRRRQCFRGAHRRLRTGGYIHELVVIDGVRLGSSRDLRPDETTENSSYICVDVARRPTGQAPRGRRPRTWVHAVKSVAAETFTNPCWTAVALDTVPWAAISHCRRCVAAGSSVHGAA